jgi:bifunctional N-acetylglucosamine-1-phosphate-uridyltransferase/glucosamine-1-phosphate-acetyltransferase GlmU-like protein
MGNLYHHRVMFDSKIFRDTAHVDYQKSPMTVLFKVMRYGSLADIRQIRNIYTREVVGNFLETQNYRLDKGEQKLLSLIYESYVL